MSTPATIWVDLALQAQRSCHLAWFLYGWLEREQRLNLDAWAAGWAWGSGSAQARQIGPPRAGHGGLTPPARRCPDP